MRTLIVAAVGGLMVAACGGGESGGGSSVTIVSPVPSPSPTPAPTPSPSPTPSASPSPTPSPASAYTRYADLTGDQSFQTACAALVTDAALPTPQSATAYGDGLSLDYTAATGSYAIGGDGLNLAFGSSDLTSGAAAQRVYARTAAGATTRLTITTPAIAGVALDHARSFTLDASRASGASLYSCVFGVPAKAADRPSAAIAYASAVVAGTAYVSGTSSSMQRYTISASTATVSYDPTDGAIIVRIAIRGVPEGSSDATAIDLGLFEGRGAVDATRGGFYGLLDSSDRLNLFSSFGGGFFAETQLAAAFETLSADLGDGRRATVIGTLFATR